MRADEAAETHDPVVEIIGMPAQQPVDAQRDGMVVEDEQLAPAAKRSSEPSGPGIDVEEAAEYAFRRVHEIEAGAAQVGRQSLGVGGDPEDRGPALARGVDERLVRINRGNHRTLLRELGAPFAGTAVEMEHALLRQVAERLLHDGRQRRACVRAPAMHLVEHPPVDVGRLQA